MTSAADRKHAVTAWVRPPEIFAAEKFLQKKNFDGKVLHPLYNRLYLPALQGLLKGILYESGTCNHGGGLFHRIILAKGNKVNVFHVEQQADVLKVDAKGIVGGYGYYQRPAVSQMCFCSHEDRSVRDSVGQFGQGVAGAGGDEEDIQVSLWTNGFGLLDFCLLYTSPSPRDCS